MPLPRWEQCQARICLDSFDSDNEGDKHLNTYSNQVDFHEALLETNGPRIVLIFARSHRVYPDLRLHFLETGGGVDRLLFWRHTGFNVHSPVSRLMISLPESFSETGHFQGGSQSPPSALRFADPLKLPWRLCVLHDFHHADQRLRCTTGPGHYKKRGRAGREGHFK